MDIKKFLLGTLTGTVASFVVAYLIFGVVLHAFFEENTMEGIAKTEPDFIWIIIGHFCFSAALTYIFLSLGNVKTLSGGLVAGFVIGLLTNLGFDMIAFATTNMMTSITPVFVDAVAGGVLWAVGGGAIGWVLGMGVDRSGG